MSIVRAVEHIQKLKLNSETNKGMFEKEMTIVNEINHPNFIKLIECFEDDSDLCLVLDYINGGDPIRSQNVEVYRRKHGSLLRCSSQLSLPFMPKLLFIEILSRDTSSFFMGQNLVVKIADFGLVTMVQESELRTTWLAPEVITKEFGPYTDKGDAWALCLVILSSMVNTFPFDLENSEAPLAAWLERCVPKWKDLPEGTSPECYNFLYRLCRQRVDERMSVTEACQRPWILDNVNPQGWKPVRLEPSFPKGWLLESLAPNPSYTATKSIHLIPRSQWVSQSSPPTTED
ncbi:kinase-like protein [Atractiella rhizophila]|nr:kinase-like protein [Atractiella rhizophila]